MRLSFNTMIWWGEPLRERFDRLVRCGYDGAELAFGMEAIDYSDARKELTRRNLEASSVGCLLPPGRDLSSPDAGTRSSTLKYMKKAVEAASELGAPLVNVAPTAGMKVVPEGPPDQEWAYAVEGLRALGEFANMLGVGLAVEAWNRYETYMLKTANDVRRIVQEVELHNVGGMVDTFHMSIEEKSPVHGIQTLAERIHHIHLADSNRAAIGCGHLNFAPIIRSLQGVNYRGFLTMELIPAHGDPFKAIRAGQAPEFFEPYAQQSATAIRELMSNSEREGIQC